MFYDLVTNDRLRLLTAGSLSRYQGEEIDKFALFEIAKYCDEECLTGEEERSVGSLLMAISTIEEKHIKYLNSIASAFRGMLYYANGTGVATQDRPGHVVKRFSRSNVIEEVDETAAVTGPPFSYEGTGRKARKTVAMVSWNDPDDRYRTKLEYVEDSNKQLKTLWLQRVGGASFWLHFPRTGSAHGSMGIGYKLDRERDRDVSRHGSRVLHGSWRTY